MKVSDIVIQFLESKKIKHVFTVSGGGCIHLIDSLGKAENLDYVCVHHEQSAAMAAEGYARLKQDVGACIVTTGPGGTNTLTGVLGCWLDSIPTLFISGQVSLSQTVGKSGCRQIGDQEFDIVSAVTSMTKYATMITDKRDILFELEKAYSIAVEGRPGPVWIDIPLDIQGAEVSEEDLKPIEVSQTESLIAEEEINTFLEHIKQAKKPLFLVGNGIRLSNSFDLLDKILKETNIPVISGVHSGVDCIDNTYEYYAGRIGILGQITSNTIVQQADLIVVLGSRLSVKMTGYNTPQFAPNAKKIFIDIDKYESNKHTFNIEQKIVGDINTFLKQIEGKINTNPDISVWQNCIKDTRSTQKYFYDKHINMKDYASAYYFTDRLKEFDNGAPIITSNGSAHVVTLQTYQLKQGQRLFTNVGCASMGYGLPAAIGAAFASPGQDITCIEGDGSLQMNIQELQTLVHHKIPVKLFVINNDGYLSIKITQQAFFNGTQVASGKESGISFPDLGKICKAYGLPYIGIRSNSEYGSKIPQVYSTEGPVVCELFTYPYEIHEPKVVHKGIDSEGRIIPGELTDMHISDVFNL